MASLEFLLGDEPGIGLGVNVGTRWDSHISPPVENIIGGLKVCDANGQSLAYVYSRGNPNDAHMAKVLTEDEARRIASNIAKLPTLLAKSV